ncbi:MAG: hypothetical protein PWP27_1392 [Clostridiales bacterium]|jgi:hypothetical protein|nr:hypothetical protein [Clostridiales bacterium]
MKVIKGVGPDAEISVNEKGGKQSKALYRMDLIDPYAILKAAKVLAEGAEKYGKDNWRLIPCEDHINHAIIHFYSWLAGDRSDEHLAHALCRAIFAVASDPEDPSPLQPIDLED